MSVLINIAYLVGAVGFLPVMLYQRVARGKRRRGWRERFGHVPTRQGSRPCIWVHAVSVGEVNAAGPLIEALQQQLRDCEVVISSTTDTGLQRARQLYPSLLVFRYPLDFSWAVQRVMRRIRPRAILLMELEVWPNLVAAASRAGVPVVILNGRVTERPSLRWFRLPAVRWVSRRMFGCIAAVGAQDACYASRFARLGVPADRIRITGSLKWDSAVVADCVEGDEALARLMGIDRAHPLWVAGSTAAGEEVLLLQAYKELLGRHRHLQLVIVPRRPERFGTVAHLIEQHGFACLRRSQHLDRPPRAVGPRTVFLGDTLGELRRFYSLAEVVFVGRSLVPLGGSDVMEVAGLAKPMIFGPHMDNFADAASRLLSARAARQVSDAASLVQQVDHLLTHRLEARRMGQSARQVLLMNQGATKRSIELLQEVLSPAGSSRTPALASARSAAVARPGR